MTIGPDTDFARNSATQKAMLRILEGARMSLVKLGAAKTTIVDIAHFAQCSRPTIYKYFNGRAEIIDRICLDQIQTLHDSLAILEQSSMSLDEQLENIIVETVTRAADDVYLCSIMTDHESWTRLLTRSGKLYLWLRQRWLSALTEGGPKGSVFHQSDIEEGASWIAVVTGMLMARFAAGQISERELRCVVRRFVARPVSGNA